MSLANSLVIGAIATLYVIYNIRSVFFRLFFVPPQNYKKTVLQAARTNKRLQSSSKSGSLRRRLIFGSKSPNFYTNYGFSNIIRISAEDGQAPEMLVSNMSACHVGDERRKLIYGFFHPYCNAGGGGERVLWEAVSATLTKYSQDIAAVYTGDIDASPQEILENVQKRFNVDLDESRVVFVYLKHRDLVSGARWPKWTLLGQAFGLIVLSIEAFYRLPPDVWVDTMGYPFGYPFVSYLLKIPIVSYTHFPIIQLDMLGKLLKQRGWKNAGKKVYWRALLLLYSFVGYFIEVPLCNGTWTYRHLNKIWYVIDGELKKEGAVKMRVLYPPCSTENLVDTTSRSREDTFLCLAQFRPEKRHELIIEQFAQFVERTKSKAKLLLMGSIRSQEDRDFVEILKKKAQGLNVQFILDALFEEVQKQMRLAKFGLNAMWNEHFGIAVVETMAAGLIPISHKLAGPYLDIAVPWDMERSQQSTDQSLKTGLFFQHELDPDCKGVETSLAEAMEQAVSLKDEEIDAMRRRGQDLVLKKFSNRVFDEKWGEILENVKGIEAQMRDEKGKIEQLY